MPLILSEHPQHCRTHPEPSEADSFLNGLLCAHFLLWMLVLKDSYPVTTPKPFPTYFDIRNHLLVPRKVQIVSDFRNSLSTIKPEVETYQRRGNKINSIRSIFTARHMVSYCICGIVLELSVNLFISPTRL